MRSSSETSRSRRTRNLIGTHLKYLDNSSAITPGAEDLVSQSDLVRRNARPSMSGLILMRNLTRGARRPEGWVPPRRKDKAPRVAVLDGFRAWPSFEAPRRGLWCGASDLNGGEANRVPWQLWRATMWATMAASSIVGAPFRAGAAIFAPAQRFSMKFISKTAPGNGFSTTIQVGASTIYVLDGNYG